MKTYDKPDANQADIVDELRKRGVHVQTGHHDLLVTWRDNMFQIELKVECIYTKHGFIKANVLRESQIKLLNEMDSNYAVCWTFEQVWKFINFEDGDYLTPADYKRKIHMQRWESGRR